MLKNVTLESIKYQEKLFKKSKSKEKQLNLDQMIEAANVGSYINFEELDLKNK